MPTLIDGDIFELATYCRLREQLGVNVSQWRVSDLVGVPVEMSSWAIQLEALFAPRYKDVMASAASWRGLSIKKIFPVASDAIVSNSLAGPGTQTGEPLSSQTAGLVRLRTGLAGRRNRGRKYIPFPAENDNTSSAKPSSGYLGRLSDVADLYDGILTLSVGANDIDVDCGLWNPMTLVFRPFETNILVEEWATQRRRSQVNSGDGIMP